MSPFGTADFAPYLVVFVVGLFVTPLSVAVSLSNHAVYALPGLLAAALVLSLVLLPRAKGLAIALLWALDVRGNQ